MILTTHTTCYSLQDSQTTYYRIFGVPNSASLGQRTELHVTGLTHRARIDSLIIQPKSRSHPLLCSLITIPGSRSCSNLSEFTNHESELSEFGVAELSVLGNLPPSSSPGSPPVSPARRRAFSVKSPWAGSGGCSGGGSGGGGVFSGFGGKGGGGRGGMAWCGMA